MKTLYTQSILALFILVSLTMAGQETPDQQREKVEKNTAPFSTDYFTKPSNSYYVLTIAVENSKLVVDKNAKIQEVRGKLPHERGNLNVRVLNANGERLANFFMPDPIVVRSCEGEKRETSVLENGLIQIPMPKSSNIASIELIKGKQTVGQADISPVVKEFIKRQRGGDNRDEEE